MGYDTCMSASQPRNGFGNGKFRESTTVDGSEAQKFPTHIDLRKILEVSPKFQHPQRPNKRQSLVYAHHIILSLRNTSLDHHEIP